MPTYFTKDHEWVAVEDDIASVGITNHAQEQLGDIVFVELPEAGRVFEMGQDAAVVESVKAASDIFAPISGTVVEPNQALETNPALVNEDAEGQAWFFRLRPSKPQELDQLMQRQDYEAFVASLK